MAFLLSIYLRFYCNTHTQHVIKDTCRDKADHVLHKNRFINHGCDLLALQKHPDLPPRLSYNGEFRGLANHAWDT